MVERLAMVLSDADPMSTRPSRHRYLEMALNSSTTATVDLPVPFAAVSRQ